MKNRKRKNTLMVLLILLLAITIGFAALATTLKINGDSVIAKNRWSVYWDSVGDIQKSDTTTITSGAAVDQSNNTQVNFSVVLNQPGDFYEFQVDAVNAGTLNAMVDIVSTVITDKDGEEVEIEDLPSYILYSVKYADDDTDIERYHLLPKADQSTTPSTPTRERIKVRIEFSRNITNDQLNNMDPGETYTFVIDTPYKQDDGNGKDRHAPSYTYYYFDSTSNTQQTTSNRNIITRNEYVRTVTGSKPELCMVTGNQDICFSTESYDWACEGAACSYSPQGTKTLALVARFTAAGVPISNESSGFYAGDSNTKMCTGDSKGYINCFSYGSVNDNGRYCYCNINEQSPSSDYCNCYS